MQEQQEDNSKGDICYLENINFSGAEQPWTCTMEGELNIVKSMEVSIF